jgi:hypothetical protein
MRQQEVYANNALTMLQKRRGLEKRQRRFCSGSASEKARNKNDWNNSDRDSYSGAVGSLATMAT